MIRFRKLVNTSTMLQLYKAFVLPRFQFCSVVWHFCSSRNSEKLESLNKRALCVVFNDRESTYSQLLDRKAATSLYNQRVQNILITIHKCIHINFYPAYLKDLLTLRSTVYSLRGTDILSLCRPAFTSLSSISLQIKMTNQFLVLQIHFRYLCVKCKFRPFTFSFVVTEFYCIDLVITLNVFPRESWEG